MPAVIESPTAPITPTATRRTSFSFPSSPSSSSSSPSTVPAIPAAAPAEYLPPAYLSKIMAFQNDFERVDDCEEAEVHDVSATDHLLHSNASGTSAATTWNENDAGSTCGVTLNGGEQMVTMMRIKDDHDHDHDHAHHQKAPILQLNGVRHSGDDEVEVEDTNVPLLPALTPPSTSKNMKMNFIKVLSTTEDEEELFNSWKVLTKTKGVLNNGTRLENASWRRWFQKKYNIPQVPLPPKALAPGSSDLDDSDTDSMESTDMADPASSPSKVHGILKSTTLRKDGLTSDLIDGSQLTVSDALDLSTPAAAATAGMPNKTRRKRLSCLKQDSQGCKISKRVSFDEGLNQVAFVSYQEDNWDDSEKEMLINVDELSRIRHSSAHLQPPSRSADLGSLIAMKGVCPPSSPTGDPLSPSLRAAPLNGLVRATADIDYPPIPVIPHFASPTKPTSTKRDDQELMGEERKLEASKYHAFNDDDEDLDEFSLIELLVELILFLRWCAGMTFYYPGSLGFPSP